MSGAAIPDRLKGAFTAEAPLVLAGAGKMGGAMLSGWLAAGIDPRAVRVIDPSPGVDAQALVRHAKILIGSSSTIPARVLVVAVKPQIVGAVCAGLRPMVAADTIVLSIAAGTPISALAKALGAAKIVRAMPNTPGQIGRGISVATASAMVDADDKGLVEALLVAMGKVAWVEEERLIDAVTALSGSGPAYVFLLVEAMAEAGIAAGLPPDLSALLARETVAGAGELLHRSQLSAAKLRENVTSPGGTTEAALAVLMGEGGLAELMKRAILAAKRRAGELAGPGG